MATDFTRAAIQADRLIVMSTSTAPDELNRNRAPVGTDAG